MKITYVLEEASLFGGNKVVLHQANLLARRGHDVTVVSAGPPPDWYPLETRHLQLPPPLAVSLPPALPPADVTVATFWTTLAPVVAALASIAPVLPVTSVATGPSGARRGEAVHYCQGFEASYTHNHAEHPAILAAYRLPLPALAVAPHLATLLRQRFGRPARVVPQPLEPFWTPGPPGAPGDHAIDRRQPAQPPRILVASPFEIDWKGVATALEAVRLLRRDGLPCRLVRLSQWPLTPEENALLPPDEFHHRLTPPQVARLMATCDLLLAPSWEQEGFGLPALEAMACGLPVVASDISSYRGFATPAAPLVPPRDPAALARAARTLLTSPPAWRAARTAGLHLATAYSEDTAALAAEQALLWVASGSWRNEIDADPATR